MPNRKQLERLSASIKEHNGCQEWNIWRLEHPNEQVDLSGADLNGADLKKVNFYRANLNGTKLRDTNLRKANLIRTSLVGATLIDAHLFGANLSKAKLVGAYLTGANLKEANLTSTDLTGANLVGATLEQSILVETNLTEADMRHAAIYGISVWDIHINKTKQTDLVISKQGEPVITVDSIEVAQFIYLLLNNQKLREVIRTISEKAVLILGRFGDHLSVLQRIRDKLREHYFLPILFDFEKSNALNYTETVMALAHLSCFVIADFTKAQSISQELQAIVPNLPSLPVQPITQRGDIPPTMSIDFFDRESVLPLVVYEDIEDLAGKMENQIIGPALAKRREREERRKKIELMFDTARTDLSHLE